MIDPSFTFTFTFLATGITYFYKQFISLKPKVFPNLVFDSKKIHYFSITKNAGFQDEQAVHIVTTAL